MRFSCRSCIPGVVSLFLFMLAFASLTLYTPNAMAAFSVPGLIQAEDYNPGGEGVGYHDTDTVNRGGVYRSDGVDIRSTSDTGGGFKVFRIAGGEWLKYDIDVASSDIYEVELRTARGTSGSRSMRIEIDGVDVSGKITIPSTGGWDTFTTVEVSGIPLSAGAHTLTLFFESGGFSVNWISFASAGNSAPTADPGGPYNGLVGSPVVFDGTGSFDPESAPLTYSWDFGDGSAPVGGDMPSHTYSAPGIYTVTLTVNDGTQNSPAVSTTATISTATDLPPTADPGGPYNGVVGSPIVFDGSGSSDPEAATLTYSWDFGDGSAPGSGVSPSHTYSSAGVYTVTLTVNDGTQNSSPVSTTATVTSSPSSGLPVPGLIEAEDYNPGGEGVGYHDTDSINRGGAYRNDGVDIRSTSDSGGGFKIIRIAGGEWLKYDIAVASTDIYDIELRAARGGSGSRSMHIQIDGVDVSGKITIPSTGGWDKFATVTVSGVPVTAGTHTLTLFFDTGGFNVNWVRFIGSGGDLAPTADPGGPYAGSVGSPVTFDGTGSSDPEGAPLTYSWDFGDGSAPASGATPSHTYGSAGVYTVTLTVNDGTQDSAAATTTATITATSNLPPSADPGGSYNGMVGSPIAFDGTGSSDPESDPLTYSWDFGDGSAPGSGPTPSHTYIAPGVYMVALTVNDGIQDSTPVMTTATVISGTASGIPVPGLIQAEDYNTGGEGVGYHDTDTTNLGGVYRTDGVDIRATSDTGGGYKVYKIASGEWLKFDIDVASSDTYDVELRTARGGTGSRSMHIQIDGVDVSGKITIPNTGGWETFATVAVNGIPLTAGPHTLTLFFDTGGFSVNWVRFTGNNIAPSISPVPDQVNDEGDIVNLAIAATDGNGDALTYSANNLPPGLDIDGTSGVISGTVGDTAANGSPYAVEVSVSDGTTSTSVFFSWSIGAVNVPPAVTSVPDQVNGEGDVVTLAISATDVDGDTLSYSATGLPPGLGIDASSGVISGTIADTAASSSPYAVQVSVSDGTTSTLVLFNWSVGAVNVPPAVTSVPDQTNAEGDVVTLAIAASDVDGDTLSYTATGLPPGLGIDSSTGLISGTVTDTAASGSPYAVEVIVSDGTVSTSVFFNWSIGAVNVPPAVTSVPDQSNDEGDVVSLSIIASDVDGDTLSYSATGLPQGLGINGSTGVISGTVGDTAATASPYAVEVIVSDGAVSTSVFFNWTVGAVNVPPVITAVANQANDEGDVVSLAISASDVDGDTLSYSATGLPPGLGIDGTTGLISGTITDTAATGSPYTVQVTVSDAIASPAPGIGFDWVVNQVNNPPVVNAGPDLTIIVASLGVPLNGVVTDDGLPLSGTLSSVWTLDSFTPEPGVLGTGQVIFSDPASPTTTATFSLPGLYTLRLTAGDGALSASDTVVIDFVNELVGVVPPPLSTVPVPEPSNLFNYINPTGGKAAAIQLGKALFWDMQVGSDNVQSCASCHFHAGADFRTKNQVSPGFLGTGNGVFDIGGGGPNHSLGHSDFPTHSLTDVMNRFSPVLRDSDDTISSMGVNRRIYTGLADILGEFLDQGYPKADPDGFSLPVSDGTGRDANVRRVEPRNTPTVINAVFNFRNFWDGRAREIFNGVNNWGTLDPTADGKILAVDINGDVVPHIVRIDNGSLASQAVGPPGSPFEMSFDGRNFPDIGKKLLSRVPLAQQAVDPTDSVLGGLAATPKGLTVDYPTMIRNAFQSYLWDSTKVFTWDPASTQNGLDPTGNPIGAWVEVLNPTGAANEYSLMEINFSLFFGLAIQLYEATLVSDQTPFDQFAADVLAGRTSTALTPRELQGKDIFFGKGLCFNCHGGPELTLASVTAANGGIIDAPGAPAEGPVEIMQAALGQSMSSIVYADFPIAGPTGPSNLDLTFDPRGKTILITDDAGTTVFDGVFPGVADGSCTPGLEFAFILNKTTGLPPAGIGGDASVVFSQVSDGVGGCNSILTFDFIPLVLPPAPGQVVGDTTFVPVGNYTLTILDPAGSTVTAPQIMAVIDPVNYDLGFYNIGVRPFNEDEAIFGTGPFGDPLSSTLAAQQAQPPGTPVLNTALRGAFKVPGLRNVELTGPYFHNGGQATLRQVVEFYNRGGDFHEFNLQFLDPDITELFLTPDEISMVVEFLMTLTDDRVRTEAAPFDHPELIIPNGSPGDNFAVQDNGGIASGVDADTGMTIYTAEDDFIVIPAVGAAGRATTGRPLTFEELLSAPVDSPR